MNTPQPDFPIYIGADALEPFSQFIQSRNLSRFYLVCDPHTYQALGQKVITRLDRDGMEVKTICLEGDEIIADEATLIQVLLAVGEDVRPFIAVGSGTLTDITRYASYVTRAPFISLPTAPSVDGYTSMNAPLVIRRYKETIKAHGPLGVFADLPTLCAAPRPLIAAGFGDMLGKLTALADWKLSHLLMDEPYDKEVATRANKALQSCIDQADEIGKGTEKGIYTLMEGLIETGLCMLKVGLSHPASGSEHHISHFWEMKLLRENRPAIFHGAKVGAATAIMAGYYQELRQTSPADLAALAAHATLPDREDEIQAIRSTFGPISDQIIETQGIYLSLKPADFEALKRRVITHAAGILQIADDVPTPAEVKSLLTATGAATDPESLGLNQEDVRLGVENAHWLRSHFTLLTLRHLLAW